MCPRDKLVRRSTFPTRQYPYRVLPPGVTFERRDPLEGIAEGVVTRFFLGADERAVELEAAYLSTHVNDPFARIVLMAGKRPKTLLDLLAALDAAPGDDRLPEQRLYRVADGGQIPWSAATAALDRHLRLAITRHRNEDAEVLISTAAPFDSASIFLQVFAWDPVAGAYNFYERRRGIWCWTGSSWEALSAPTRGEGPFDSHVNGNPVMKELKLPWMHWDSQAAPLLDDCLAPNDPLRTDPLYKSNNRGGEDLERLVRSGIGRWTDSRFARFGKEAGLEKAEDFLRHVLTTTTVNIVSSSDASAALSAGDRLRLPTTFFVNADSLIEDLRLPAVLRRLSVDAAFYLDALSRYRVRLQDGAFSLEQDSQFAFAVPESALEDRAVVAQLLRRGYLSRKLGAAMLMVDFAMPIFSERREALLRYVPEKIGAHAPDDLDTTFVAAVQASSQAAMSDSAEAEFLALWATPGDWEKTFSLKLEAFWQALQTSLSSQDGFDGIFRLAEYRRRQFRRRPLAEFGLTLPVATALDLPPRMRMTDQATIE